MHCDGVPRSTRFDKLGRIWVVIFRFFRRDPRRTTIATLYKRIATASRAPGLYAGLGLPDTLEGRFEALCLHMEVCPAPEPATRGGGRVSLSYL